MPDKFRNSKLERGPADNSKTLNLKFRDAPHRAFRIKFKIVEAVQSPSFILPGVVGAERGGGWIV
jgi:hypothetical protein